MLDVSNAKQPHNATGVLVLADGTVFWGRGFGAARACVGEICFNTGMSGYQEILTDPSYAGQVITFTFPHIGNVGANDLDMESAKPAARGMIVREDVTEPSNWRAIEPLDQWMKSYDIPGISGLDTRALTRHIRDHGAPNGVIAVSPSGDFNITALKKMAAEWPGLNGMDLAKDVTCEKEYVWTQTNWDADKNEYGKAEAPEHHVVAIDFGIKRNILRNLAAAGCKVTVVPAQTSAEDILKHKPDGIFLSNGPGDPAATGTYAVATISKLIKSGTPIFGICLGHQLLALALGGKTKKMELGHRGANHPVKDLTTGKVEITSQNHGFRILPDTLPQDAEVTHVSLFDGSNEGLRLKGKPVFSVQYHPEASPGPRDSHYLFQRFVDMMKKAEKAEKTEPEEKAA